MVGITRSKVILAYIMTFCPAYLLTFLHLTFFLRLFPAYLLTFFLACFLASLLTFYLAYLLAFFI